MEQERRVLLGLVCHQRTLLNAAMGVAVVRSEQAKRRRRRRSRRTCWTRSWLLRRPEYGQYEKLMGELAREDPTAFRNFQRVDQDLFQELLDRVGPRIKKQDTTYRPALSVGLRLAITLRYLATGDSYMSLQYGFRVANNTIAGIIPETCEAIIAEYADEVMRCPRTADQWKAVSDQFATRWNFFNTVGALDGKHIAIKCPPNSGSVYYNYKGFFSIILLALVDADYKFLFVDVGSNGR